MNHFFAVVLCATLSSLVNADNDTSVTKLSWFWPLIIVSLVLLLIVPCVLILIAYLCFMKHKDLDDSDESSIRSVSPSSMPIHRRRATRRASRYSGALFSPPPPYTRSQPVRTIIPRLPPAYEDPPVINPPDPSTTPAGIQNSPLETSLPLNTSSLQTFQA